MTAPVSLRAIPLHPTLAAGSPFRTHVLVRTTAARERAGPRPRLTVVLVLDVSGSMQGEPLEHVVRSSQLLADILSAEDSLGVVTFASSAHTVAAPRRLDASVRADVKRALGGLRASGGTNLSAGLSRAALELPPRGPNERQLLLVLSDGAANEGVCSLDGLVREVNLIRSREVAVSTLGYGASHNEDLLVALANAGGGRYAFVSDPLLARSHFINALGSQLDIVAENVRLLVAPDPGVEIVRILGRPPATVGPRGLAIKLQDPIAGEQASLVLELAFEGAGPGPRHLLELTLEGKAQGIAFEVGALASVTLGSATGPTDPEAAAAVAIGRADEMREEARSRADRSDFPGAIAILEKALGVLEGAGGAGVADAIEALKDDIDAYRKAPTGVAYENYKKAQRHEFDFAAGSKPLTNQVRGTPGTASLTARANGEVPAARLVVQAGTDVAAGTPFALGPDATLGRDPTAEVPLVAPSISRRHARVVYDAGAFWLFDLGSSNATCVNGQRVQRHRLQQGDVVQLGNVQLRFEEG